MGEPRFQRGQLVRHTRLHGRAVIFEVHPEGGPNDIWPPRPRTVEEMDSPWYKILVHGSQLTSFVPETELVEDESGEPIQHPKLDRYFDGFEAGVYVPRLF